MPAITDQILEKCFQIHYVVTMSDICLKVGFNSLTNFTLLVQKELREIFFQFQIMYNSTGLWSI